MTDRVILRMIEESCNILRNMEYLEDCRSLMPTYAALVGAAKANHPNDPFIQVFSSVEGSGDSPNVMNILLTQLRIALESLQAEQAVTYAEFEATAR
jgi:hypothetical protein